MMQSITDMYDHFIYTEIEWLTNIKTKITVYIFKRAFIIKGAEINSKKNTVCKINFFTVYTTFGTLVGKQIVKSFIKLIFMWAAKLMKYFIGDVGVEVMPR